MDIVIAGGGPNGLMLACELSLAGVTPLVVERLPRRSDQPKANGIIGQVVRLLRRRGLAGQEAAMPAFVFGAMPLHLAGLDDNPLHGMGIRQPELEELLERRAIELGVEIRRGHELAGFTQDDGGVTLELVAPGGPYRLRTRHLVGCDGAHSTVRKLSGIGFPGVHAAGVVSRTAHVTIPGAVTRQVELEVPEVGTLVLYTWHRTERGAYAILPAGPGVFTVAALEWESAPPGDDVPMTIAELRASLARVLGADLPLAEPPGPGPHLLRRLNGRNTRVADRYREGRVFLAGDAAHVHSAMGAPGLNLGLQDAANLAWKLAAEVRGWAPPGLRHPLVGRFLADLPAGAGARARPVLLDATGGLRVRHGRVDVVPGDGPEAVLVRPDGYVAWAGTPDETLEQALHIWFGESLAPA